MKKPEKLPESFRSLLWSDRFEDIHPTEHRQIILVQAINYGTLAHWRWLIGHYGLEEIRRLLVTIPITTIRPHVRKLVGIIFQISEHEFNHAPRGSHT